MASRRTWIVPSPARPATPAAAARAGADYGVSDRPDWRGVSWRAHLRAVTIDGRRVHVVDIGPNSAAPPALFIHGLGGRWQNWLENIAVLAQDRRVVAFDLPGFGRSQVPTGTISIERYAATVERLCDLLELDPAIVVGNSMGAAIAAQTALDFPERVRSLVLVSTAAISIRNYSPTPVAALLAAIAHTPLGTPEGVRHAIARRRARHLAFATLVRHPTLIATDVLCELVGGRGAPGLGGALAAMIDNDLEQRMREVSRPTLIVHGRDDMLVPVADSTWLRTQIPNSRLEIVADTGHLAMLERPVPFNRMLAAFAGEGC